MPIDSERIIDLPGIGRTFAADFARIGITRLSQLCGKSPEKLFLKLKQANERAGHATSKNYLYVLRMAVYAAEGGRDPDKLKWSEWSDVARASDYQQFEPGTRSDWRRWLSKNHKSCSGVWLVMRKSGTTPDPIPLEAVCEELVCFGWVDSKPAKLDERRSKLLCTPRKPRSAWSRLNKLRVERMAKAGKIVESGKRAIAVAKENGQWSRLDAVERLEIPVDLSRALKQFTNAYSNFSNFPKSVRRGILEWIEQAKRSETRDKRVQETARLAAVNQRANQCHESKHRVSPQRIALLRLQSSSQRELATG
jgi:uncharacterized protein YdeI (YjbR/CyaY-like superfamily)